ncbi:MAG TPA: type II toxin-antitoxin system prevent-host-death family antitoxin [Candidatus Tumulicola sp.]
MKSRNIHEAKTHFSALIADVQGGDEIVIAKAGVPVARLVPIEQPSGKRTLGYDADLPFHIAPDFDEYVPEEFTPYLRR